MFGKLNGRLWEEGKTTALHVSFAVHEKGVWKNKPTAHHIYVVQCMYTPSMGDILMAIVLTEWSHGEEKNNNFFNAVHACFFNAVQACFSKDRNVAYEKATSSSSSLNAVQA
ncbi:hypothetical protein GOBAR_DD15542 [Gossypium barbadense]|nr:hypothetical protein GOBAR_DD15542 [Gossypium barbadense]